MIVLVLHSLGLIWIAKVKSPVADEVAHLPAGISHWIFGRFDLYDVNPPVPRMLGALPVLLLNPKLDWTGYRGGPASRSEFSIGEDFVRINGLQSELYFFVAMIPFSLLGAYFCFRWGKELFGEGAGLFSCVLWCTCPNVLGNASLLMPDVPCAAVGLGAIYYFWRWLVKPNWEAATTVGVFLGGAILCKSSNLLIVPCFVLFMLLSFRNVNIAKLTAVAQMVSILLVALLVLNLGYAFDGTGRRLDSFDFVSNRFSGLGLATKSQVSESGNRFRGSWAGAIPIPVPQHFLIGIDKQSRDLQGLKWGNYLRGEIAPRGWWYFYLYGMAVKYPLGLWVLLGVSIVGGWQSSRERRAALPLLVATILVFLIVLSVNTGFSHHFRYVMAILPLFFVLASGAFSWMLSPVNGFCRSHCSLLAAVWFVMSSLFSFPHGMSYFNESVGGPVRGDEHMIYSNFDWGQDLYYLRDWLEEHPEVQDLQLAYFGASNPRDFGIDHRIPPLRVLGSMNRPLAPGWYVVSASFYRGFQWYVKDEFGRSIFSDQETFTYFQQLKRTRSFGYTLYLYHVEKPEVGLPKDIIGTAYK
jgi:4-amino-4-deoxy-L-arabinose transferase-like glycosyltransferase